MSPSSSSPQPSNVPFLWEESPGKPTPTSTHTALHRSAAPTPLLQLPPKLQLFPTSFATELFRPDTPPLPRPQLSMNQKLLRSITNSPLSPLLLLRRSCSLNGAPQHQSPPPQPNHHASFHAFSAAHDRIHIVHRTLKHNHQKLAKLCKSAFRNAWSGLLQHVKNHHHHHPPGDDNHGDATHARNAEAAPGDSYGDGDAWRATSHSAAGDRLFFEKTGPRLISAMDDLDDRLFYYDARAAHHSKVAPLPFEQMRIDAESTRSRLVSHQTGGEKRMKTRRRSSNIIVGRTPLQPSQEQKQERIHAWLLSSLRLHEYSGGRDSPSSIAAATSSAMAEEDFDGNDEETRSSSAETTISIAACDSEPCPPTTLEQGRYGFGGSASAILWNEAASVSSLWQPNSSSSSISLSVSKEKREDATKTSAGGYVHDCPINPSSQTCRYTGSCTIRTMDTDGTKQEVTGARSPWPSKIRTKKYIASPFVEKGRLTPSPPRLRPAKSGFQSSSTESRSANKETRNEKANGRHGGLSNSEAMQQQMCSWENRHRRANCSERVGSGATDEERGARLRRGGAEEGGGRGSPWPWLALELGRKGGGGGGGGGRDRRPVRLVKEAVANKIGKIQAMKRRKDGEGSDGGSVSWAPALATYLYYEEQQRKQKQQQRSMMLVDFSSTQSSAASSFRIHLDKFPSRSNRMIDHSEEDSIAAGTPWPRRRCQNSSIVRA